MQDSMFTYGEEEEEEEKIAKKARRRPASKRKLPKVQLHPKGEKAAKKKGIFLFFVRTILSLRHRAGFFS